MRRPTFLQGAVIAAGLATLGAIASFVLLPFLSIAAIARLLVPALALAYLTILLTRSGTKTGKVTVMTAWFALAVGTWIFVPEFIAYLLVHTAAIWLIRSLYFYSGPLPSLLDLALSISSAVFALATLHRTGSVFLATWGFFLAQALFVALPNSLKRRSSARSLQQSPVLAETAAAQAFADSQRQAEAALRQLIH